MGKISLTNVVQSRTILLFPQIFVRCKTGFVITMDSCDHYNRLDCFIYWWIYLYFQLTFCSTSCLTWNFLEAIYQLVLISLISQCFPMIIYGWNFSRCIFSPNIVTFFATLTAVFEHFLHWFDCFNYFYGSITCAAVGKTKFLTLHLRLGTWKQPLNMDDFEVFSHLFPFCISSYKP